MKILITGAFGFVGTNLSKMLSTIANNKLIAVDLVNSDQSNYNEYYSWDELNKIDWNTIDVIIHLAGKAHDTKNISDRQIYFDINVGLTKQIFTYYSTSKAKIFIYFSSVKAVADSLAGEILTEDIELMPGTPYGLSKKEAESYLLSQQLEQDKKLYILRPCMIHGPGNRGNLNLLFKIVSKGIPWPLGAFDNKRSFVSINNLNFIIDKIIQDSIPSGIYNIADDEPVSTNRLIQLISETLRIHPHIWNINKNIISIFTQIGDILKLPLNSERLAKLTESYVVSNKKLKEALGIEKMPVSAEEGMKKTLSTFLS